MFLSLLIALTGPLLFYPSPASAETQYVIPSSEIAVRRGQGTDYRIVAVVKDGTPVEIIEQGESYSKIRLDNEKEGWILTRFLSPDPPLTEVVASLGDENEALKTQQLENLQEIEDLSTALADTEQQLQTARSEYETLTETYKKLQKDTANVIEIKNELAQVKKQETLNQRKIASLTEDNEKLISDARINWFLAGAGILLLGMILGKLTSRSRRHKPSLL